MFFPLPRDHIKIWRQEENKKNTKGFDCNRVNQTEEESNLAPATLSLCSQVSGLPSLALVTQQLLRLALVLLPD